MGEELDGPHYGEGWAVIAKADAEAKVVKAEQDLVRVDFKLKTTKAKLALAEEKGPRNSGLHIGKPLKPAIIISQRLAMCSIRWARTRPLNAEGLFGRILPLD